MSASSHRRDDDLRAEDNAGVSRAHPGVVPNVLVFRAFSDTFITGVEGGRVGQWESPTVFIADIAVTSEDCSARPFKSDSPTA